MLNLLVVLQVLSWKFLFKVRNDIIFLVWNAHLYVQQVVLSRAESLSCRVFPQGVTVPRYMQELFSYGFALHAASDRKVVFSCCCLLHMQCQGV